MLTFIVTYKCRPGRRDEFLEALRAEGIDAAARAEAGNLRYDYFLPVDRGDELLLIEQYRDDAAVAAHVRQAHVARMMELTKDFETEVRLERYEGESAIMQM